MPLRIFLIGPPEACLIVDLISSGMRRKSKVPGVMITQLVDEIPEGMTTPDFTRKPIGLTIQEGKSSEQ